MAYREPLTSIGSLTIFTPPPVVEAVAKALKEGREVEMEHSSFSDPGPDRSRVLIDGSPIFTIPGY